jgi:DNA-binding MarR family transcriptional regulator
MEQSTLFTTSKWDLLQVLSRGEASPMELAAQAHTSLANISQQLRLLELAGFVKSRRIPNRDKGKPRIVYSLTDEFAFIVVAAANFVEKKFIKLSQYQKAILRCWFCPDPSLVPYLERALGALFTYKPKMIAFDSAAQTFYVSSEFAGKDMKLNSDPIDLPAKSFPVKFVKEDASPKSKSALSSSSSLYYLLEPAKMPEVKP